MAQSIEELSFELSVAALAEQERTLAGLRTRAGTVLAAASIASSFLAAKAGNGSMGAWAIVALVGFLLSVASAIWILLPHSLVFAFRGEALLAASDRRGVVDVVEAYRAAGMWIEPHLDTNRDRIARLSDLFGASCVFLALEVVLWTLSVAG